MHKIVLTFWFTLATLLFLRGYFSEVAYAIPTGAGVGFLIGAIFDYLCAPRSNYKANQSGRDQSEDSRSNNGFRYTKRPSAVPQKEAKAYITCLSYIVGALSNDLNPSASPTSGSEKLFIRALNDCKELLTTAKNNLSHGQMSPQEVDFIIKQFLDKRLDQSKTLIDQMFDFILAYSFYGTSYSHEHKTLLSFIAYQFKISEKDFNQKFDHATSMGISFLEEQLMSIKVIAEAYNERTKMDNEYTEKVFDDFFGDFRRQNNYNNANFESESTRPHVNNCSTQDAVNLLGVKEGFTIKELKTAHKRMMSKHHPDKLIGNGASEKEIEKANIHFQKIQDAYEHLKLRTL